MTNDKTTSQKLLGLESAEWKFLLKWVLASAGSSLVGLVVYVAVSYPLEGLAGWVVADPVGRAAFGAVVGSAQWLVLRKRVHRSGRWVLASIVGWAVGATVSLVLVLAVERGVVGTVSVFVTERAVWIVRGAVVGIAQWVVLRKRVHRSGWWVLASTVGWAVGMVGAGAVGYAVSGAIAGTITGYVLTQLLRHPIPEVRDL
jgi:hypothetical protein